MGTSVSRSKAQREELHPSDFYPTPDTLAQAIVLGLTEFTPSFFPGKILEPSAGGGPFVRACRRTWPRAEITAVELQDQHDALKFGADHVYAPVSIESYVASPLRRQGAPFDLIIGNPPFSHAREHIDLLLPLLAPDGVLAFLMKLSFFGSHSRVDFWESLAARGIAGSVRTLVPRPSFGLNKQGKKGTDSQEYGVFTFFKVSWLDPDFYVIPKPLVWASPKKTKLEPVP